MGISICFSVSWNKRVSPSANSESIPELNWIQNSDSFWDTCSSLAKLFHTTPNYFLICWKWEKIMYFSLHLVGHLLLQNDQKFSRAQFIIKMTCFLTCTGENHQFIFTLLLLHSFLPVSCPFFPWNLFVLSMNCDCSGFDSYCLHNGITASDFKAVSISAFSLYSALKHNLNGFHFTQEPMFNTHL